jgi:Fic family protein
LLIVAVLVVRFLAIHPFQDGNGRMSRALTTDLLLKSGYRYVPYSSMEAVIEQEKSAYYLALRQTQTTLRMPKIDWQPWVVFFLWSLKRQKDNLEIKVNHERILLNQQPEHAHAIPDLLRSRGRITVGELEKLTTYSRHNLKKSLEKLVKTRQIQQNGVGKGTWYTLV